ncbi:unnamed protein product [Thelazia callipaeda]|uniref:Chitin-binding type-2 domain-containing protein n=1 Tax=Thelazia callipaeda TaxID=103827 RepID=A0A0N5D9B3_THECL|nr:unnamed protein product [Thelazia callipaeda]
MIVIQLSYYQALSNAKNVIAQCDATKFKDSNSLSGNGNGNAVSPHPFWRSIIGDICQLPSIPRPTNDPSKYIECVFQADNTGNRTHLGIWITKKCPSGYQFVAPARKCETIDFIENQQQLCDGPNREYYEFCLQPKINSRYMVKEVEQQMEQCICLDEEKKCECPKITTIELVPYSDKSNGSKVRFVRDVACPDHHITHCRDCTTSSCICGISTAYTPAAISFPSFPTAYGFPQLPSQQTRAGCRFLDSGELYCPQLQKQVKIPLLDVTASQPCALVNGQSLQNARYQGICSWMIDPLIADPESPSHFLQCQPAPKSSYCGRWQRMPCEPDLIFNAQLQVCVWNHVFLSFPEENPGPIPAQIAYPQITPTYPTITKLPSYPLSLIPETDANAKCNCGIGVQIGSCNANGQCPGHSTCKANQMDGQIFVSNILPHFFVLYS